uniref:Uncharacterized protein n=1 Tax=Setaria digitata TaxID=48799 RepID=A0A915PNJ2_9BILA
MLSGWLTTLQCYVLIIARVCLLGLFGNIGVDCSSVATKLTLAKETREPGQYCVWQNYNRTILNFKERDLSIALIFTIDHNLTPTKLKSVLDMYHAIACLLPNESNHLYAITLHLHKNPKLYFGKLLDTQKLHRSFEEAGEVGYGINL